MTDQKLLADLHKRVTELEKNVAMLMDDFGTRTGWEPPKRTYARIRDTFPATGEYCYACGLPQYETPSGVVCENGHGGAPPA